MPLLYCCVQIEAVLADFHIDAHRQGVDDGDADAVQTAGDRIGLAVELATGVQHGQRHLDAGHLCLRVDVDRNATAVVHNPHATIGQQCHDDGVAEASQRLVHRVVHNLLHEVVQAALAGRADIHARPLADGLKPFESGEGTGGVCRRLGDATLGRFLTPWAHTYLGAPAWGREDRGWVSVAILLCPGDKTRTDRRLGHPVIAVEARNPPDASPPTGTQICAARLGAWVSRTRTAQTYAAGAYDHQISASRGSRRSLPVPYVPPPEGLDTEGVESGLDNVAVQWPRTGRFYDPVAPAQFVDFGGLAEHEPNAPGPALALADRVAQTGTVRVTAFTELVDLVLGLKGVLYATDAAAEDEDPVIDPDGCAWIGGGLERFVNAHVELGDEVTFETATDVLRKAIAGGRLADQQLRWLDSRIEELRDEGGDPPSWSFSRSS